MSKKLIYIVLLTFLLISCDNRKEMMSVQGNWIKGNPQQQIELIEKQFRGFDMAMVETGYRYQELYWAGKDQNWDYAEYQFKKLNKAIKNGLERRPKRAASAQHFLTVVLPDMQEAIKSRDSLAFVERFNVLTVNCNVCHAMEKVPYFMVKTPLERQSPIR